MYPLFDELDNIIKNKKDFKEIDINRLCVTINNIANNDDFKEHYEQILALIYYYDKIEHDDKTLSKTPYDSKMITREKGIIFNTESMPTKLLYILSEYINKYR